ncbi:hypothetical protein BSNK01_08780 [Bacillaceae bacterium]
MTDNGGMLMERYLLNKHGLRMHIVEHLFGEERLFILCHGFTGSTDSHVIKCVREMLTEMGESNVSLDFTNNLNLSEGNFAKHTIRGEIEDLDVVYRKYRGRFRRIYLIGHSMGCTVVTQYAAREPVDGLILVAPAYSIKEVIEAMAKAQGKSLAESLAEWKEKGTIQVYKAAHDRYYPLAYSFYEDLLQLDLTVYGRIACPVSVIYSTDDAVVPPEQSRKMFAAIASQNKELIVVKGAPHSFDTPGATGDLRRAVQRCLEKLQE